jgi:hypothetical protein
MSAWGAGLSQGSSASFASTPPDPVFASTSQLSQSQGFSMGRTASASGGRSSARSAATQSARTRGTSRSHARAQGRSIAEGESEQYVTVYETLATQMYSLEEQLTRLTGEIMGLQPRECFIKLPYQKPLRTRTKDLAPAYRSLEFRDRMLPRFLANAAAASPYLAPVADVDAEIASRAERITAPPLVPERDLSAPIPNPTPLDNAVEYADGFLRRQGTRKSNLRLIDGGAGDNDKP